MQKIEKWKQKVWFSILLNIAILIGLVFIFRPGYETNDDIGIQNIVSGVKGNWDAHLVYINYLLGLLIAFSYKICPVSVSMYAIMQYFVLFLAFTAISYVLFQKIKSSSAFWIILVLLIPFSYEGYIKIQYTKTAGIVSAAGLFLLCYALTIDKYVKRTVACALVLCAVGFMYRDMQFLVEGALLSAMLIPILWEQFQNPRKGFWKRGIILGGGLFLILTGLYLVNERAYRSAEWKEYQEFNELRTELYDYGFPDYTMNQEAYEELGIDKNAYQLYRGWNFEDTDKFTVDVMRQLVALKEKKAINRSFLQEFFDTFPIQFFTIASFNIFLVFFVISLLWGDRSCKTVIKLVYETVVIMFLYFYLYYRGRYLYNRVDVGIWLSVSLTVLWGLQGNKLYFSNRSGVMLLAAVLCVSQGTWNKRGRWNSEEKTEKMMQTRAAIEQIHNDPGHLYLTKVGLLSFFDAYGVFDQIPVGMSANIYALGGWTANLPIYFEQLDAYEIQNPYKDMIGNEKIYLVDNEIGKTMEYIHTYYDAGAKEELVTSIGKLKVYQIQAGS